ncbi:unnamed protein product [Prunus armeniaca]|uniref:Uncharacterized protein n=1 Tax=Prunus armeniaca TaxID=36596 RepID=A0A6J5Y0C4_PRUAR|nr:unnamed protein product [Prunus armeniaca]CAB4319570.1 unnamed protein product [Prunus armeniaca]
MAKSGGTSIDQAKNEPRFKVPREWAERAAMGGDLGGHEEAWIQSEFEEVQGEVGEHKQVLQESKGEQQEKARGFQDVSLLSPAG